MNKLIIVFMAIATNSVFAQQPYQTTTDIQSSFSECELPLSPIPQSTCGFDASLDTEKNLNLTLTSPNQLGMEGQFGSDFPDVFQVNIPASEISTDHGNQYLWNFKSFESRGKYSDLCSRSILTHVEYKKEAAELVWKYTTFSDCSHDNYSAEITIDIESNLHVKSIHYVGFKSQMPMGCSGGNSHGFQHRFECKFN